MNCQEAEPLLFAERDGLLTERQRADLDRHYELCPACRQRRDAVTAAMANYREDYAAVEVPNVDAEWRALRARLGSERTPALRRLLAPLLWVGVPVTAAAALALAFFVKPAATTQPGVETIAQGITARAEFVEVADKDSSPVVFVDKDSGWLVVWAVDGQGAGAG